MKINKGYKVIIIILVVYFLVFFCILGLDNLKKNKHNFILLVGESTVWEYASQKWLNVTASSTLEKINWQEYQVYIDNQYVNKYQLWFDDKWYAFNIDPKTKERQAVQLEGDLIAYKANYDLNIKSFKNEKVTNNTYIQQVLNQNGLSTGSKLTVNNVVQIDIDNDGNLEEFYVISNAFPTDNYPDTIFSIVFMVKNEQIYPMYSNITKGKNTNGCKPFIRTFLDIDEDNIHEVIVSCGKYSIQKPEDMLFQLSDKEFKLLISNQ